MKAKVATETIRLVAEKGNGEYEGSFEKLLPVGDSSMDEYYIWNQA